MSDHCVASSGNLSAPVPRGLSPNPSPSASVVWDGSKGRRPRCCQCHRRPCRPIRWSLGKVSPRLPSRCRRSRRRPNRCLGWRHRGRRRLRRRRRHGRCPAILTGHQGSGRGGCRSDCHRSRRHPYRSIALCPKGSDQQGLHFLTDYRRSHHRPCRRFGLDCTGKRRSCRRLHRYRRLNNQTGQCTTFLE